MGMSAEAHLAYGYDLGTGEDFKAAERGEYGEPKLPWLPTDEDGDSDYSEFGDEVEKRLFASIGFTEQWKSGDPTYWDRKKAAEERIGVELTYSGHDDYSGWVLVAKGSERSVEWSEVMEVDAGELLMPGRLDRWDGKLAEALKALGITPAQDGPKWLVFPSYG